MSNPAPVIEVHGLEDVRIDGVAAGRVIDVICNYPQHLAAISAALFAWRDAREQSHAEEVASLSERLTKSENARAALQAEIDAAASHPEG